MMKVSILFPFVFSIILAEKVPPVVDIPSGNIEGDYKTTVSGRTFYSFEGVPYARPPVGKYRFKEPVPVKPWSHTWVAKTIYKCLQYYQYTPPGEDFVIGDEDCLYLNIYTPTLDQNANLDVIVYIHGGAFMFNWAAKQGPQYILDKDVVYINFNYRLGPLGFLSTESDLVPGNNGMRDQILALQWVKDNVKYFGGNPNSVTIIGMSAGSASVHFHYISPKSRGLFHRGISQSGTTLNNWVLMEKPLEKTRKLASAVGCPTENLKQLVKCLKKRSGRQIVGAVKEFQPWLYIPFSPFGIVVDSWSSDPMLPDHPYDLIRNKIVNDVPWIASHTNSEGLYPAAELYGDEQNLKDLDSRWDELIPHVLDYNYTVDPRLRDQVSQKIRKEYFGEQEVSKKTFRKLIDLLSDRLFVLDIQKTVRLQTKAMKSPIYSYYFTYRGAHSSSEGGGTNEDFGASHADDTSYLFRTQMDTTSTENDRLMVQIFVGLVTSFAKTGKPEIVVDWPPVSKVTDNFTYLKIESPDNITVETSSYKGSKFWDSLPIAENEKLKVQLKDEL